MQSGQWQVDPKDSCVPALLGPLIVSWDLKTQAEPQPGGHRGHLNLQVAVRSLTMHLPRVQPSECCFLRLPWLPDRLLS